MRDKKAGRKVAKRTVENCSLVKKAVKRGIGTPQMQSGKCMGYSAGDNDANDEPCEKCKVCKLSTTYGQ